LAEISNVQATIAVLGGARLRTWAIVVLLSLLLVFCAVYSVTVGRYDIAMWDVWLILWDNVAPAQAPTWTPVQADVVEVIRLPRILAALLIGAGLAMSGAALQGLFRNPLVDPINIGVTAGAGFGGTLACWLAGAIRSWLPPSRAGSAASWW
jgi:iron complex transport system permease protein